jgi:arabinofuranan 3-O-arabinosyltransferase
VTTIDYYSETPVTMPAAIAEWGIAGLSVPSLAPTVDTGCKPLLEVHGRTVDVRAIGPTDDVLARRAMTLTQCGGDGVAVPDGEVRVSTAVGKDAGVDLDRVVLRSAAGGHALGGATGAPVAAPTVTIEDEGRVSYKLQVDGATAPFWLVLGQSQNDGWKATMKGAGSLGAPTLIDGYANGWYVTPTGSGSIEITLSWTPQRVIWIAIGLSAIGLAVCIALIAVDWARRRTRVAVAAEEAPDLATLRHYGGTTPSRVVVAISAVITGVVVWFMAGPVVGALAALTVACGLLWPRMRPVVILLAPGALAGAALFILAKQLRYSLEPSFEWPTYFDKVHVLGWIGVSTLVADLVIREVRSRSKAEAVEKVEDERHDEVSLGEGGDVVQPVEHVEGHV